jgi:hypothetical protein
MDALAAGAIQRVPTFALSLCVKIGPVRPRTPEALLELPNNSKTSAGAKGHSALSEVRSPFTRRAPLVAVKVKIEVLQFFREE